MLFRGLLLTTFWLSSSLCSPAKTCVRTPPDALKKILGPAFNARYMSFEKPSDFPPTRARTVSARDIQGYYRDQEASLATSRPGREFFVDPDLDRPLPEDDDLHGRRRRESSASTSSPWGCKSRLEWVDLGEDHFPRYLQTVSCVDADCWFGHFRCKPRAFAVKVLRRKGDECEVVKGGGVKASSGEELPSELREKWGFVERAVTFCCDCALAR